jgi:anti-sigma regulatory factor (Ser/Thr protein kinase)
MPLRYVLMSVLNVTMLKFMMNMITLAGAERSVACARRFVREVLGPGHPVLADVELAVSELATNAIKHSPSGDGGKLTIGMAAAGRTVRVEVTNEGTPTVRPRVRRDATADDGRGLLIVETISRAWGVTANGETTTVWAEFPVK